MSIEAVITQLEQVVVVGLIGDLDLATAPEARQQLLRVVHQASDPPRVVVDLIGVDFLDAVGIGVLLAGVVVCRSRGGDLALCRAEPQVLALLQITRVDEILPALPDVASAEAVLLASDAFGAR
jgi:anti-sigma B factor antagonist